jgi:hypothetical protein
VFGFHNCGLFASDLFQLVLKISACHQQGFQGKVGVADDTLCTRLLAPPLFRLCVAWILIVQMPILPTMELEYKARTQHC